MSGKEVIPLVDGGKGISISTGETCGAWAAEGGIGTFSAVNADSYDAEGNPIPQIYHGKTRQERRKELIEYAVAGGITQAKIARERSNGKGRIHMNALWEMGGSMEIIERILEGAKDCVHGVVCGAGMPYELADIAAKYKVYYYPIVSSARAFSALFRRSFKKVQELLGGVVYEDPWLAGGHNGVSNADDPNNPQNPYLRLVALRSVMNEFGLYMIPIIIAGGVWWLSEWEDFIDNKELGPVAFQFGTRTILTKECPVAEHWHDKLMSLKPGDVKLTKLSPTGFYSSAINNEMISDLLARLERQAKIVESSSLKAQCFGREVCLDESYKEDVARWTAQGFNTAMLTPDQTVVFVTSEQAKQILHDQQNCCCCLSACRFSSWCQNNGTTGRIPDPRTFCIQKNLQNIAHGGDVEKNLMFAGHRAYRFGQDPFYANGFIPTVHQLFERILTGY
ncbi:MAG: nitronate monooxygenase [Alphaproteobacteria bacterium]|nr:nitronate monooxygenase [Alphaproteobacteria bacterium]